MSVKFKMFSGRYDHSNYTFPVIGEVNNFIETVSVRDVRTEKIKIDSGVEVLVITIVYAEKVNG
jgi:hypothetical protein